MTKSKLNRSLQRLVGMVLIIYVGLVSEACRNSPTASDTVVRANGGAKRMLGSFQPVEGTKYLMAPINSESKGEYSKGSYDNVHNFVFFNTADESTHALLPANDYWITQTKSFPEKDEGNRHPVVIQWFLYFLVKSDTDGDKELTHKDNKTLAVSDAGGVGYTEIISDVEQVYGHALGDANTMFLFYRSQSKKRVAKIDLPSKRVVSTTELELQLGDVQ